MDCLAHVAVILRAIIACHQNVRTDRQTDKDVNEKINKGTGRADCSQRLAACKTPHHDHICRIEKKLKKETFEAGALTAIPFEENVEEEKEFKIVRTKRFSIKPMSTEEAILQMNLLDHQFFIFNNADTDEPNVVYKRKNGDYGLIELA